MVVSDFFVPETRSWDRELIEEVFPKEDTLHIMKTSHSPSGVDADEDRGLKNAYNWARRTRMRNAAHERDEAQRTVDEGRVEAICCGSQQYGG